MREWLKNLRKEKNLTQFCVAKALQITPSYYNMIESGERQSKMTIETAQKLANFFNVPLDFILENEKEQMQRGHSNHE